MKGYAFSGDVVGSAGDWILLDPTTGTAHLDIRATIVSKETGASIYMQNTGILRLDEHVKKVLGWSPEARTTESKDRYFMVTPKFEVSSERLRWMERTVFVGHGHFVVPGDGSQAVEYELYKVNSV